MDNVCVCVCVHACVCRVVGIVKGDTVNSVTTTTLTHRGDQHFLPAQCPLLPLNHTFSQHV